MSVDPLFSVDGQIVFVSGGSRGIGKAIAVGFAERGAEVIVTGTREETVMPTVEAITSSGHRAVGKVCDVSDPDAIRTVVREVIDQYKSIDTLVNVAGVNRRKPALDISEDDYDFVMNVNFKGAFLLSQEVGRQMVAQGRGSQINIASLNTDRPLSNVMPYAASKAAMESMTRSLAQEWGPSGVRVNGLAPGFILTDLTEKLWSDAAMKEWGLYNTPQRRMGRPEDMVGTAIFLASDASSFLTGQTIFVDGGFTAGWRWPIPESGGQ